MDLVLAGRRGDWKEKVEGEGLQKRETHDRPLQLCFAGTIEIALDSWTETCPHKNGQTLRT